jgi:cell division protein ZapB
MRVMHVLRLTWLCKPSYSGGMISEFQELSDKIDQLAEMTIALRRENAELRQRNAALAAEAQAYQLRLAEASRRVSALLAQIPPDPAEAEPQPHGEPQ